MKSLLVNYIGLPTEAADWLEMLWDATQTFDDFADGDNVIQERLNNLIWNTLVAMPNQPFFVQHASSLRPAIATAILKWHAANAAELERKPSAMSFAWRAGFYDIVLLVYALCFGQHEAVENAYKIMKMYGEDYADYIKEIGNA